MLLGFATIRIRMVSQSLTVAQSRDTYSNNRDAGTVVERRSLVLPSPLHLPSRLATPPTLRQHPLSLSFSHVGPAVTVDGPESLGLHSGSSLGSFSRWLDCCSSCCNTHVVPTASTTSSLHHAHSHTQAGSAICSEETRSQTRTGGMVLLFRCSPQFPLPSRLVCVRSPAGCMAT